MSFTRRGSIVPPGVDNGARVKIKDREGARQDQRHGVQDIHPPGRGRVLHAANHVHGGERRRVPRVPDAERRGDVVYRNGAKTGDERRLEGKGLPRGVGSSGGDELGDHVVVVEVKRETTPEREAAAMAAGADAGEPSAKRARTTDDGPADSMTDLEKLLAEKEEATDGQAAGEEGSGGGGLTRRVGIDRQPLVDDESQPKLEQVCHFSRAPG